MRQIDSITGNRYDDPELDAAIHAHEQDGTLERVVLELGDRKKSRLRVETDAGTDLGIIVDRPELRAGDVLFIDEQRAAIVTFQQREAYVIELPEPADDAMCMAVELGHRIGNQHWDIALEDRAVYIPVEADKHILEDVLENYIPGGASTRYEQVDAALFLDQPRNPEPEKHGHEHEHSHIHSDQGHEHTHTDAGINSHSNETGHE
ncbi:urease accessory protein UreE [Natronomonas salina]|uniref:urease accessory protein UreE n=1 Tax=Natronomonas salina TaxID=1710540 RepID=UPI0015B46831|nr:urease accessory protein UreE [Natronomonas salina]QLD89188.1 urease accessory protein UreE [Natronomonas salina]